MNELDKLALHRIFNPTIAFMAMLLIMFACATSLKLLDYTPGDDMKPENEWGIHKADVEWWYLSGRLTDSLGNQFFFQYTLFHGIRFNFQGYSTHLAVSDLQTGKHIFEERNFVPYLDIPYPIYTLRYYLLGRFVPLAG